MASKSRNAEETNVSSTELRFTIVYSDEAFIGGQHDGNVLRHKSPFVPSGSFPTVMTMDLDYQVLSEDLSQPWNSISQYDSFEVGDTEFHVGDFVWVANDHTFESEEESAKTSPEPRLENYLARILEVRGIDDENIFLLVYWIYRPGELPDAKDGDNKVRGRQLYHGDNEVIPSNHLDIISSGTVDGLVTVVKLTEEGLGVAAETEEPIFYWRQCFHYRAKELSKLDRLCSCEAPENPDEVMVQCGGCDVWLHEQCIVDKALNRVYNDLGIDRPHIPVEAVAATNVSTVGEEDQKVRSGGKTKRLRTGGTVPRPWEWFFEAKLDTTALPAVLIINDLRVGIEGGDRAWMEPINCPACDSIIQ